MDDEDKGFFILVLGVLAAVLMVVLWWAIRSNPATQVATPLLDADAADHADADHDADGDHDADRDHDDDHDIDADEDMAGDADAEEDMASDADAEEDEAAEEDTAGTSLATTVLDTLGGDANLSSISGLIGAAGLSGTLSDSGPYTVLAPSNAAVNGLDPDAASVVFGGTRAADTLNYHVIAGSYTVEDLRGLMRGARSAEVETLHGDPITLTLDGDQLIINGNAVVSSGDAVAGNGVVHTIENVLVPREAALNLIVSLDPIQFGSGSAVISQESTESLDQLVDALASSDIAVQVQGHTDNQGDDALNQALSEARATAVLDYLVANGIEQDRLSAQGFGEEQPIADNETDDGRAQNRRIEFRIDN